MSTPALDTALLTEALRLSGQNLPYAWAIVVRAAPPTSAYVGAQAIITADGRLHGWVGGGCAQDIVVQTSLDAIRNGRSRLIRISNDGGISDPDTEHHAMPCASNGTLDLFIQAVNPAPSLHIAGASPAAVAAGKLAAILGWRISLGCPKGDAIDPDYVLVATQGTDDEQNLENALRSSASKVLLIASRRKAHALIAAMRSLGISEQRLADLESPAGPDILACTPAEVALAAVAGLVHAHRKAAGAIRPDASFMDAQPVASRAAQDTTAAYINPVCLRAIDPNTALHTVTLAGSTHYFCCNGCKTKFDNNPEKYLEISQRMSGSSPA